jgi:hypothetical protein
MLVQAVDRQFYRNPMIYGEKWFVKISSLESEIYWQIRKDISNVTIKTKLHNYLKEKGIKGTIGRFSEEIKTAFPPNFDKFVDAKRWSFSLRSQIPVPDQYEFVTDFPTIDEEFYAETLIFPIAEIQRVFQDTTFSRVLAKFMTDEDEPNIDLLRHKIKIRIIKQFPEFKRRENLFNTYGVELTLKKWNKIR